MPDQIAPRVVYEATFRLTLPVDLEAEVQALKNLYILAAMRMAGGNQRMAAELVGMKRERFHDWLQQAQQRTYEIVESEFGPLTPVKGGTTTVV